MQHGDGLASGPAHAWTQLSDPTGHLSRFVDVSALAPAPARADSADEVERHKEQGNRLFRAKDYSRAAGHYTRGLLASESGSAEEVVLLANRAAALLSASRFGEALIDVAMAASTAEACATTSVTLRNKIEQRRAKAAGKQKLANEAAVRAADALARRAWAEAIPAFGDALAAADQGGDSDCLPSSQAEAAAAAERSDTTTAVPATATEAANAARAGRASLLCGRSEALAAVGDFAAALADARHSHSLVATERAAGAIARLGAFLGSCSSALAASADPAAAAAVTETGMAPLQSRVVSQPVAAGLPDIKLRELYLCTTGGRLWHAALLLAHYLISPRVNCRLLTELQERGVDQGKESPSVGAGLGIPRVLEVGAGLGLVGLAVASASWGLHVTLSDCDRETVDNLRAEVALNGMALDDGELVSLRVRGHIIGHARNNM